MAKAQGPEAMQPKANNETAELQRIEELRVHLQRRMRGKGLEAGQGSH